MAIKRIVKLFGLLFVTGLALLAMTTAGSAQEEDFRLNINRSYGYSSGSEIRGQFKVSLIGKDAIRKVTFLLDGSVMKTVESEPFEMPFHTQDYASGWHTFQALVETTDGKAHRTAERRFEFVTAEAESAAIQRIIVPLFGGVLGLIVLGMGIQFLVINKIASRSLAPGTPRKYGFKGGAVCQNCGRPFSLHWWSPNLVTRVYDRCDYCGHWSILKPARREDLAQAELAEKESAEDSPDSIHIQADALKTDLKQKIEDSRYFHE